MTQLETSILDNVTEPDTSITYSEETGITLNDPEMFAKYESVIRSKFVRLHQAMSFICLGMDIPITLGIMAMLIRQHILLIGRHGEGKTMMANMLASSITNKIVKYNLFHDSTDTDEVFGIPPMANLEKGLLNRRLEGTLASCHIGICDEIFKGRSSLHTSMYSLLNERVFNNGSEFYKSPLETIFGLSNEVNYDLPSFLSRFLFKIEYPFDSQNDAEDRVKNIKTLLDRKNDNNLITFLPDKYKILSDELEFARICIKKIKLPENVIEKMIILYTNMVIEGYEPDKRKLINSIDAVKAYNWFLGMSDSSDNENPYKALKILKYTLIDDLESSANNSIDDHIEEIINKS